MRRDTDVLDQKCIYVLFHCVHTFSAVCAISILTHITLYAL